MREATLSTDGGSRGNPGRAGLGINLVDKKGGVIVRAGWYIGKATNNVAEYSALIWGLMNAQAAGVTHLTVCADSELVVKQVNGQYQVKSTDLKPLFGQAKRLLAQFEQVRVMHVYRADNKEADEMANKAMDEGTPVGAYLAAWEEGEPRLFAVAGEQDGAASFISLSEGAPDRAPYAECSRSTIDACPEKGKGSTVMRNERKAMTSGKTFAECGGTYEMTIKDHFDAAHELPGYDGPCRYLHGHTWDVEVTVSGTKLDDVGILYDFKDLKRDLHTLLDTYDHGFINDVEPFDTINPTAENLARVIYHELSALLPGHITLKDVAVWESPIAKLVYRP